MRSLHFVVPFLAAALPRVLADETIEEEPSVAVPVPACTATSASGSGAFFDLRPDTAVGSDASGASSGSPTKDYHARGWDYGKNFTLNICGSVVEPVTEVVGVSASAWANVSAFYTDHDQIYSIGSASLDLTSRGRKLVLQYTGGSPCGNQESKSKRRRRDEATAEGEGSNESMWTADDEDHPVRPAYDPDDSIYPSADDKKKDDAPTGRRKSTTISFLCDRDPAASSASISFVGTDPEQCAYFFEARSIHACAHAEPHKPGSVGPGSVFSLILIIAVLVYILGGVFYNRTISHARGWRQLPNYSLWANIWNFTSDLFFSAIASCARCLPSRTGYSPIGASSRNRNAEAENRLIDQLDEEWED